MAFFANEQKLTIAMPKGRIFEEAVHFLQQAGLEVTAELQDSRKLVIPVENASLEFILAKPADVLEAQSPEAACL